MSLGAICESWRDVPQPVIGMVHLRPLPGAPGYAGDLDAVAEAALADARALEVGGVHGLMIENFGDAPFFKGRVGAETVAAMTAVAAAVRQAVRVPIGINVLRNDGRSALAVAAAVGAAFIRVNVLTGATLTDQGIIEGEAAELLRARKALGAEAVAVLADVQVKHAAPLVQRPLEEDVDELIGRGGAAGLIVSGWGTGAPTDPGVVQRVKAAAGDTPVFIGSGATSANVAPLAPHADGFIVGTGFKRDGVVHAAVDPARVEAFVAKLGQDRMAS
ncbi:MAG: BtpA/SgcQ family protein [Planctomycetes bacterium]|jgi:membrane complex biogenesis BtpA family protein|nr:BtpA/SgcQ family protein [Planctomycetota bacterium]